MTDYEKALADARDALAIYRRYGAPLCGYATNAIDALDDLLDALDAAREQAVAWQVTVVDNTGTHDYAKWAGLQAPPAAAVPDGYALVPVADLESLAFTDFGRAFWTDGAEAAALRIRAMLAAANKTKRRRWRDETRPHHRGDRCRRPPAAGDAAT